MAEGEKGFEWWALKICFFMVIVFFFQLVFNGFTELFVLNSFSWVQPWRFLTAVFLHADIGHLLYNLLALAIFGLILEKAVGTKKFFVVFFASGILANLLAVNFYSSSLGASGAIFGVIGALVVLKPGMIVWAFSLPMPMFVAGAIWAFGDIIGAVGFFTGNPLNNTGNLAHLAGMAFGMVYGVWFRVRNNEKKAYHVPKVEIDENSIRMWEERHLR